MDILVFEYADNKEAGIVFMLEGGILNMNTTKDVNATSTDGKHTGIYHTLWLYGVYFWAAISTDYKHTTAVVNRIRGV